MATVKNGFLGDAIGKLGNVVFRKWNSLITASKYQPMVNNPNSSAQQLQRLRIKNLALSLQPFKSNIIPLNFENRKGRSTSWAEAIRANYPLLDERGTIDFKNMVLSGSNLVPPVLINYDYNPFINQFNISYSMLNETNFDQNCVRVTAVGRKLIDKTFNCSNICRLPYKNSFSTYITEMDLPDWPLNFDFDNAWSDGMFFYNIVPDPFRDVRAYKPANIVNKPSAGAYFMIDYDFGNFDFNTTTRILMPSNFHPIIIEDDGTFFIKIGIDPYTSIPGLLPDDVIYIMPYVLEANANKYNGPYTFNALTGLVDFPLQPDDETKPFIFLYFVMDAAGVIKSIPGRFYFNIPSIHTYTELIVKNGMAHPDGIIIHSPFTAIWGDLKDFVPADLILTVPYSITSKNVTSGEIREHVISPDNLFYCSKLLRNQLYDITISDGTQTIADFSVIGFDDDYSFTTVKSMPHKVVKFKAGNELASKVK